MLRRRGVSARPMLLTADMKGIVTRLGRRSFSVGGRAETLAAQSGIAQRRRIEPDGARRAGTPLFDDDFGDNGPRKIFISDRGGWA